MMKVRGEAKAKEKNPCGFVQPCHVEQLHMVAVYVWFVGVYMSVRSGLYTISSS